ncbi:MAG: DUF1592 domain-containing protein [Vicinamibacterales bacterium]
MIAGRVAGAALVGVMLAAGLTGHGQERARPGPGRAPAAPKPGAAPKLSPAHASTPSARGATAMAVAEQSALLKQYCIVCHNDRMKTGGLTLAAFDPARAADDPSVAEKMIRKLRAGMMPPPGVKRPPAAAVVALAEALEARMDRAAALDPNPGWRPSQRLSRAEYALAVQELVGIDVDVAAFLPPDTISAGFDNIADSQTISPTLMEGYLRAASRISRMAIGDRRASPSTATWKVPRTASQMRHVEGAPLGTRGGLSVVHVFPADGDYVFKVMLHMSPAGELFGAPYAGHPFGSEQIEISINGERAGLLTINPRMNEQGPTGMTMTSEPIRIEAGPQRVSVAFLSHFDGPIDDLMMPVEHTLADTKVGESFGTTALPHIRDVAVTGPMKVTGLADTPSRRTIFTCRPARAEDKASCASEIIKRLATRAYRGPVGPLDLEDLMGMYERGAKGGGFEEGVRLALQAILASPRFLLRLEQAPATLNAGETYRLNDLDLASRLSFFLWGTIPDAGLVQAATSGALRQPAALERQVRRMLADRRSEALASRFASQWLRLQDVEKVSPDYHVYSHWDTTLSDAMVRETELFFESLLREDRSVLDLLTADHTFVNERLAKHYGIPNVLGPQFRRVTLAGENRRGILGQGSVLLLTSVADRTSPVLRGKWVMEVLLGSPPPPPPPDVPMLEETKEIEGTKRLTVRERMEEHRKNPACTSCHRVIDPLGLALENFDATGAWRMKDNGNPIDATGDLYDGTRMEGPVGLRNALLKHKDVFILSFTESLMTYALGRRVAPHDMPTVRAIVRNAGKDEYRLSSFILGVVKSAAFRMSRVVPVDTTASR